MAYVHDGNQMMKQFTDADDNGDDDDGGTTIIATIDNSRQR